MNASPKRLIDRLKGHLPDILNTNVPIPAFMEAPITLDYFFKPAQPARRKSKSQAKPAATANTLEGKISSGKESKYAINEKDLEIDNGTWIVGNIEFGIMARAKGRLQGEKFYVSQLIILKK